MRTAGRTDAPAIWWPRAHQASWLRFDLVAGLTAAVVIPQAMAYAVIAGLPVEVGLYTAAAPMAAYALTESSRALSVRPSWRGSDVWEVEPPGAAADSAARYRQVHGEVPIRRFPTLEAAVAAYRDEPATNPRRAADRQPSERASWAPGPHDANVGHRLSTTTSANSRTARTAVATIPGRSRET